MRRKKNRPGLSRDGYGGRSYVFRICCNIVSYGAYFARINVGRKFICQKTDVPKLRESRDEIVYWASGEELS
jgi:hypothetical protein